MTKYIKLSTITAMAVFSIVGCGSSSSSSVETGTGYYVDAAVEGVKYECGTIEGTTGVGGIFTFEKGKECTFSLAGIPLRTTKADNLIDGKEVFENNPKVAKFLQSIDADGDLSNGIQITDEVLTVLTLALETSQSTGTLPEGTVLTEIVADVGYAVTDVSGDVRTDEDVREHLAQTQTEITKGLLAGKTFYVVGEYGDDDSIALFKIVVNKEGTSFKSYKLDGTFTDDADIKILGNKMIFTGDNDNSYTLISQEDGYVLADDRNADGTKDGIGHRLYASQSDAQVYFDSVKGESSPTSSSVSDYIIGKTYYITTDDSYTDGNGNTINNAHVETLNFNADGKTLNITWTENGETKSHTISYSVDNDTLTISGTDADGNAVNESLKAPVTETSDYIIFSSHDKIFFKTYAAAKAALESENAGSDDGSLSSLLAGKTLYRPDYHDGKRSIIPFTFNDKMTSFTAKDEAKDKTFTFNISTTEKSFIFTSENRERKYTMTSSTNDYVEMDYRSDGEERVKEVYRFYFNRDKATVYMNTLN